MHANRKEMTVTHADENDPTMVAALKDADRLAKALMKVCLIEDADEQREMGEPLLTQFRSPGPVVRLASRAVQLAQMPAMDDEELSRWLAEDDGYLDE